MLLLGVSGYLSFRYWKQEALQAAGQQALLGATSARAAVESALVYGRQEQARSNLKRLYASAHVRHVRVYGPDGTILFAPEQEEEGRRLIGVWLPSPNELPDSGLVEPTASGDAVRAFLPVRTPHAAIIEVEFSVGPLKAAIDRGARFGLGLLIGSLFAFVAILFMLLEREYVAPLRRMARAAARAAGVDTPTEDALGALQVSVAGLIEQEAETKRRELEQREQLVQQAGLAQVGEIAAEMAHEFKRPLASVRTAMQLLGEHVSDERGRELLGMVDAQLERLTETMRDMFALAHPEALHLQPMDVRDLVDESLMQLAGHPALERIALQKDFAPDALTIWGDKRRLCQAVGNLLANAVEAMPEGGSLTIRTRQVTDAVELSIADTGPGIPPEEVERVLRPFYSTKELGTGLGLPLVARIVGAHEGRLLIEGEAGFGTTIRMVLPTQAVSPEPEVASWRTPGSSSLTTIA